MQTVVKLAIMTLLLLGQSLIAEPNNKEGQDRLDRHENRPDLGISYVNAAKFKLASRKTNYRLGEMISLDLAMINTAKIPVYFDRLLQPNFLVRDFRGQNIDVVPYMIVEPAPVPDLYALTQPGEIMTKSFQILAGCDKRALQSVSLQLDDKDTFERDTFVNWGDLCLRVTHPGAYKISVEQGNNNVVVSTSEPSAKTAIGVIQSTPLTIRIMK
jgi:hypothetical protein